MKDTADLNQDRQEWMSLLAKAPEGRIAELLHAAVDVPAYRWLRKPEIGSVMVQGRAGGTGAPFNLGEMTVTRCALQLDSGTIGHAYLQGRRKACAEAAALVDALMQEDGAEGIAHDILDPLRAERGAARTARASRAAATKVDFFTMVRGDS